MFIVKAEKAPQGDGRFLGPTFVKLHVNEYTSRDLATNSEIDFMFEEMMKELHDTRKAAKILLYKVKGGAK